MASAGPSGRPLIFQCLGAWWGISCVAGCTRRGTLNTQSNFCHPVSNDVGGVKAILGDTSPQTRRKDFDFPFPSAFWGCCCPCFLRADQGSCSLNLAVDARSHHPSLRYVLPQLLLRTPRSSGRQAAYSSGRFLSFVHTMTRARLHNGLAQLRVIPVLAQHQIQPGSQLARHRYFRQRAMLALRESLGTTLASRKYLAEYEANRGRRGRHRAHLSPC